VRRSVRFVAVAVVTAAALLVWGLAQPDAPPPTAGAAVQPAPPSEPEVAAAPPAVPPRAPVAQSPEPAGWSLSSSDADAEAERLRMISQDVVLRERARQQMLAEQADARWHEAVDGGEYAAADLDPAVVELFRNIDLVPRYTDGGYIDGLVIQSIVADHPLALSGFQIGDRIDRIQGTPLRDPREIPSLLAHLGPNIEVCAEREGRDLCRDLEFE